MADYTQEFPGGSNNLAGTLRIEIAAFKLEKQNLLPKEVAYIQKGARLYSWSMIAPTDIQESISHMWEEMDAIQGRMQTAITGAKKGLSELKSMMNSAYESNGKALGARKANILDYAKYKIDSPMVYSGSNRREYSFTFPMMEWYNIKADVVDPIAEFRRHSCASIDGENIDKIDFPSVFSVTSSPYPFISIPDCALTDVQVTYSAPYKNGYPQRAELTLTFKDLRPLYKGSWGNKDGTVITVGKPKK